VVGDKPTLRAAIEARAGRAAPLKDLSPFGYGHDRNYLKEWSSGLLKIHACTLSMEMFGIKREALIQK